MPSSLFCAELTGFCSARKEAELLRRRGVQLYRQPPNFNFWNARFLMGSSPPGVQLYRQPPNFNFRNARIFDGRLAAGACSSIGSRRIPSSCTGQGFKPS